MSPAPNRLLTGGISDTAGLEPYLVQLLPPLYAKVRRKSVARVARRLANVAPQTQVPEGADLPERLHDLLVRLQGELAQTESSLAHFVKAWSEASTEAQKQALLLELIDATAETPAAKKEDVRALRRWLGFDALRERLERRRQELLTEEETALRCLRGALEVPGVSDEGFRMELGILGLALLRRANQAGRPASQLAALEAFDALIARAKKVPPGMAAQAFQSLVGLADQPGFDPFVQAEAVRALLRLSPGNGRLVLERRLSGPYPSPKDFLFRRQVLEVSAPLLTEAERIALFARLAVEDPSEYVRMGLCTLLEGASEAEAALLRRLSGREERSPKVRAAAVIALSARTRLAGLARTNAWALLAEVVRAEESPLVQRIAAEQLAALAEHQEIPPEVIAGLEALRVRSQGPVREAAAVAEQACRRASDPVRKAWTQHLREAVADIPLGGRRDVRIDPAPAGLPPLPEGPEWLGAILADLSADGFGLSAERRKGLLRVWRGDRFARRAWRTWHELGRPAPNKRQAHVHTIGRKFEGTLRAHPQHLDEITETMVPGERVHVATEGSWGRHLPTVDDLLDLPLSGAPVRLFSSHGVTVVNPAPSFGARLANRAKLTFGYERWAKLRLSSLQGQEPRERRRYAEQVERELGIRFAFEPYPREGKAPPPPEGIANVLGAQAPAALAVAGLEVGLLEQLAEKLADRQDYWLSSGGNGVVALAVFTALLLSGFLYGAWSKRRSIAKARSEIPLSVGGWGTRGKSGTERLKAALFGGLGFEVFAKTTGSEAMFVHTAPNGASSEFFIFRPYDKATIWEQKDMVELGRNLGTEVFLWECMALQPNFVELLQNDWMHDDLATLTNAYPDHEDIQGPAGIDVASVITNFMPRGGTVVTSEDHFLPLFEEAARSKKTRLVHAPAWQAELIPDEVLDLFPYREHPRNVALVAKMAEQLGVPRGRAIALMAEHVQPEIGVLKVFGPTQVRGRQVSFINGHSANERTGFLNNWVRTGLDKVDPESNPHRAVVTVINNRWDRVARSEVFARILVDDASADRHVLIGTNLEGLQKYVRDAVDEVLARREVVSAEDLQAGELGTQRALGRLAKELAFLKVPRPTSENFFDRLRRYARGASLELSISEELRSAVAQALEDGDSEVDVEKVRRELSQKVATLIDSCLVAGPAPLTELPEVIAPATAEDVREHALFLLARLVVHARLQRALPKTEGEVASFHRAFREGYRSMFLEQLVPVPDAHATGDQVVDAVARAVPPGLEVSVMGAQNIKGTGLDWVYRWVALDRVQTALASLKSANPEVRRKGFDLLDGFEDHGIIDSGLAKHALPALVQTASSAEERERLERLATRVAEIHVREVAGLEHTTTTLHWTQVWARRFEEWFDYLDSVQRRRISDRLLADLIAGRVSHPRAALETRKLYERQKGGWLLPSLAKVFQWKRAEPEVATVPAPAAIPAEPPRFKTEVLEAPFAPARREAEPPAPVDLLRGRLFEEAISSDVSQSVPVADSEGHNKLAAAPVDEEDGSTRRDDAEVSGPTVGDPAGDDEPERR